ncbi:HipA domain-containing protein, partial [Escherichia coli]|nr:HipA domain-containing protein [Escherichia coli]
PPPPPPSLSSFPPPPPSRLSEAYDLNPVARSDGLKLNITENDNALDLELAREVAEYFRLGLTEADDIIANFRGVVSQWRIIAERLRLPGDRKIVVLL